MFTLPCTHIYPHALCHCPAEPASLPARDALPCPALPGPLPVLSPLVPHPVTPPIPTPATPERAREKKRERDGVFL